MPGETNSPARVGQYLKIALVFPSWGCRLLVRKTLNVSGCIRPVSSNRPLIIFRRSVALRGADAVISENRTLASRDLSVVDRQPLK